jgi:glycosyltransferase involved in cell wall biosynthesis
MTRIPHERMIDEFYSQIDALVHPTGLGKEACSNVIMEALALGIPVVTTRYAGMHGQLLEHRREALVVPRFSLSFAAALHALKENEALRRRLAVGGREFAERHHDLEVVGRMYGCVFDAILQAR